MKKSLLCITIILICLFSGCSSEKSERSATSLTNAAQNTITASALQANKTDDTALIENTFSMDGRKTIQTMSGEADGEVFRNLEALYQRASNIVAGTVEAIEYTDIRIPNYIRDIARRVRKPYINLMQIQNPAIQNSL